MKLLILTQTFAPEVGGAPTRLTNMARGLRSRGHEVDVVSALPNYPHGRIFPEYRGKYRVEEERDGVRLYRYWTYASTSSNPLKRMASMFSFALSIWGFALKREKIKGYDAVIIQTPHLPMACSGIMIFKKIYGKKIVLNISDLWPGSAVDMGAIRKGSLPYKVLKRMERYLYRNADYVQGQSREIIDAVAEEGFGNRPTFLYRNIQPLRETTGQTPGRRPFKIIYAGLLGVAQDILGLIRNVDFRALGAELHIYGTGAQAEQISRESERRQDVFYYGPRSKEEIEKALPGYNAGIVPLALRIQGAVPSKMFDLLPAGVPILFCGGGEGAEIVKSEGIGITSEPGDYDAIRANILSMQDMSEEEYQAMRGREIALSREEYNFDEQLKRYEEFLKPVSGYQD